MDLNKTMHSGVIQELQLAEGHARFTLMVDDSFETKLGARQERILSLPVAAKDWAADQIDKAAITNGDIIVVEGKIMTQSKEDLAGKKTYRTWIIASNISRP